MALVLPVVFALILGLFTGGLAYNRKISMVTAAREGGRYGATLPVSNFPGGINDWLAAVANAVERNSTGDIGSGVSGRTICVAYVYPSGTSADDRTTMLVRTDGGDARSSGTCFDDGRPDPEERRVQVHVSRNSKLEVLLFSRELQLSATSITRFEAS